ncbi:MAG: succinylglutamate desuccinylase/aspartoacylase family protein [Alphaproteobacteria bacterium]|nr:succinylglutamate desuccinylase/aspartoacylase family protein [Alphaproteobacteria bacterium]
MSRSPIFTDIDYEREGKQVGFLHLPYSPHTDAWGTIPVPVAIIRNGDGPTVVLMGGNHGDEYEGPIVLGRLIRELDPRAVRGRLIFLPAVNLPAVRAGSRVSPVDGKNMNRTFPGDPLGTPTEQISHYVDSVVFPLADAFMDLHSGGSSLDIVPSVMMQRPEDAGLRGRTLDAVLAFNAPLTVVMDTLGERRTSSAAALARGLVVIGSELGSAGAVSLDGLAVCERGVRNVLHHLGVLPLDPPPERRPTRLMQIVGADSYVFAPADGIFEPFHPLGTWVEKDQPAGQVVFLDDPGRTPVVARFRRAGYLFCRRAPGRVERGNGVCVLLNEYRE